MAVAMEVRIQLPLEGRLPVLTRLVVDLQISTVGEGYWDSTRRATRLGDGEVN